MSVQNRLLNLFHLQMFGQLYCGGMEWRQTYGQQELGKKTVVNRDYAGVFVCLFYYYYCCQWKDFSCFS